jgi:DUF4097 and DUF4098 domain-containing protein YvlB
MTKKLSLICVVLLLFAGCDWFDDDDGGNLQEYEVTDTYTWTAADFQEMDIQSINGRISAMAAFTSEITVNVTRRVSGPNENEVEARIDSITVDTSRTNGHLTVEADMPNYDGYNYSAAFDIIAPPDIVLMLTTVNGDVSANGFSEGWFLNTINGNVDIENQNGEMDGFSVNGSVEADILSLPEGDNVTLSTVNGNVNLYLPADVSTEFMASTAIGEVEVLGFNVITYVDFERKKKSGTIGDGEATVTIVVTNGNITIEARD